MFNYKEWLLTMIRLGVCASAEALGAILIMRGFVAKPQQMFALSELEVILIVLPLALALGAGAQLLLINWVDRWVDRLLDFQED